MVLSECLTFTYLPFIVHFLDYYYYDPVVRPDMYNLNNILRSLGGGGQKSFQYKNRYFFKTKTTIKKIVASFFDKKGGLLNYQGPFLYYVRVFWGFFEPPTHLRKDIVTT